MTAKMTESVIRFLIGGTVVLLFSVLGDLLRPKSFAGLFGSAPSVALASLGLAFAVHGPTYVALLGRSMILGALGLASYTFLVARFLVKHPWSALATTVVLIPVWFGISLLLCWALLGGSVG